MDFIGEQSENYRSFASLGRSSLSFISKYKQCVFIYYKAKNRFLFVLPLHVL